MKLYVVGCSAIFDLFMIDAFFIDSYEIVK